MDWTPAARHLLLQKHIRLEPGFDPVARYALDVKDDVVVYAAHLVNRIHLYMLCSLVSQQFKKIYFVYSLPDGGEVNADLQALSLKDQVELIRVANEGYDFKKYLVGLENLHRTGYDYNRVWLMNDSFVVTSWDLLAFAYKTAKARDLLAAFQSNEFALHPQSYLLILSRRVAERYRPQLMRYSFGVISSHEDKLRLIIA